MSNCAYISEYLMQLSLWNKTTELVTICFSRTAPFTNAHSGKDFCRGWGRESGSVVGSTTMLQAGGYRIRFQMRLFDFSIDLIFLAAL